MNNDERNIANDASHDCADEKGVHKPINLLTRELENDITTVINNCRVPPFIIVMVLRLILSRVERIADSEYITSKNEYDNYINK